MPSLSQEEAIPTEHLDHVIIGAGISGINASYRVKTQLPGKRFVVLEGRDNIGGTWDLFKYPGIRSDSDLFTFAFEWNPWPYEHPIAEGSLILSYLEDTIDKFDLKRFIRFRHKVVAADWSSKDKKWTIIVDNDGQKKRFVASWMLLGTGYYDYSAPLKSEIPGIANFRGDVIHPQFWDTSYDYTGRRMTIIGSGATAISILPAAAKTAAMVTMISRSPGDIVNAPNKDRRPFALRKWLPFWLVAKLERIWHLYALYAIVTACHKFPNYMRSVIRKQTIAQLPSRIKYEEPAYLPWRQRMCFAPDNDFFEALRGPHADVCTGKIKQVTEDSVEMEDGRSIKSDIIVTATGIRMLFGSTIAVKVDGEQVTWAGTRIWNGAMMEGVPNAIIMNGYTNAAWTLGSDDSAIIMCRVVKAMEKNGLKSATPRLTPAEKENRALNYWQLDSSYSREGRSRFPVYSTEGPWKPKTNPPADYWHARLGGVSRGLHFTA